jgi:hypothetical protein
MTKEEKKVWLESHPNYLKSWREANPEKCKEYSKRNGNTWKLNNPEKLKSIQKAYRLNNPEKAINYRLSNSEKIYIQIDLRHKTWRKDWHQWLEENGYGIPSHQWHYHHEDPDSKSFEISYFIKGRSVTPQNIKLLEEELEKCVFISAQQHKQIHGELTWKEF